MPTFYLSNLNPGSTALGTAAAFTGAVTTQPATSSANQTGTDHTADAARAYFRYYTNSNSDTVTFTDSGDLVTQSGHSYSNGEQIEFSTITSTSGISTATKYYIISSNTGAGTYQLASTVGGSALALTTDGSGIISTLAVNGVTSGSNGTFAFTNPAALQTDFLSLLATEVFGSSEAADLFSNTATLRTSHDTAVASCITKLNGLVDTSGAAASSELIDAMMLASNATNHRFTLPYKASMRTANDIVTADDLNVADFSCTFTDTTNLVTTPIVHGLSVNDKVFFTDINTTTGINTNTIYFVLTAPSTTTFTLAATEGGGTVALTNDGHGGFCAARSVTFTIATDLVGLSAHGYVANQKIEFNNVVTTTGVAADTTYYVRANNMTANAFEISASEATYTITAADNKFTLASHGYTNNDTIVFSSITSTTGFSVNTTYHIVGVSGNDFQIATSQGGSAVALTTDGSATAAGAAVDLATGDGKGAIRVVPTKVDVIAQAVVLTDATDKVTLSSHGYSNGDQIQFARISNANNLTVGTIYYVVSSNTNDFQVATTSGGSAIAFGTGSDGAALIVKSMNVATHECTFTDSTDLVTFQSGHGYVDHDMITFSSVNTTTGISVDTIYYLRDNSGDTFKLAETRGGSALTLTNDGNGIISKTVLGANKTYYTDTQTRHVMGLTSGSAQAALSMALNPVQAAMLNGSLNDSTNPTEVPLETGDVLRMLFTVTSKGDQEDTSGDSVTATQTFFLDYTLT